MPKYQIYAYYKYRQSYVLYNTKQLSNSNIEACPAAAVYSCSSITFFYINFNCQLLSHLPWQDASSFTQITNFPLNFHVGLFFLSPKGAMLQKTIFKRDTILPGEYLEAHCTGSTGRLVSDLEMSVICLCYFVRWWGPPNSLRRSQKEGPEGPQTSSYYYI